MQQYKNSNTTGVRVVLESRVVARALLLLSARVLVNAWPQDMRTRCIHDVHKYLIAGIFVLVSWCDSLLYIGSSYDVLCVACDISRAHARAVRSSKTTATTGV